MSMDSSIRASKRSRVLKKAEDEEINRRRMETVCDDGKRSYVYFGCYNCLVCPFDTVSWYRFDPHSSNPSVTVDPIWTGIQSQHSAFVGLDSRIYCLGGCENEYPAHSTSRVTVFDPLDPDKGWVPIAPMLLPRAGPSFKAVASDGKIYAFGGLTFRAKVKPTFSDIREKWVEVYDPCTETWSFLDPLSVVDDADKKKLLFDFLNPHDFELYYVSVYVADGHRLLLSCASWPLESSHTQRIITEYIFDTRSHSLQRPGDVEKAFPGPFGGNAFVVDFSRFYIKGFNFQKSCWQYSEKPYTYDANIASRPNDVAPQDGTVVRVDDISSHTFCGGVHLLTFMGPFADDLFRCTFRYHKLDLKESVDVRGNEIIEATPVSQIDVHFPSDQGLLFALLLYI